MTANFARLGFHHGFGLTVTLPAIVGQQRALEMLYTGVRLNGEEAHRIGLLDRFVEPDEIDAEAARAGRRDRHVGAARGDQHPRDDAGRPAGQDPRRHGSGEGRAGPAQRHRRLRRGRAGHRRAPHPQLRGQVAGLGGTGFGRRTTPVGKPAAPSPGDRHPASATACARNGTPVRFRDRLCRGRGAAGGARRAGKALAKRGARPSGCVRPGSRRRRRHGCRRRSGRSRPRGRAAAVRAFFGLGADLVGDQVGREQPAHLELDAVGVVGVQGLRGDVVRRPHERPPVLQQAGDAAQLAEGVDLPRQVVEAHRCCGRPRTGRRRRRSGRCRDRGRWSSPAPGRRPPSPAARPAS